MVKWGPLVSLTQNDPACVTRCTIFMYSTCGECASAGYTRCSGRTSVYSLPNLAVPLDFYFHLCVSVERSSWPCFRWCETGEFKEQGQCFLLAIAAHSLFVVYCFLFPFFLFICWYCGAGVFRLIGCKSLSPSLALFTYFNNYYYNNNNLLLTIFQAFGLVTTENPSINALSDTHRSFTHACIYIHILFWRNCYQPPTPALHISPVMFRDFHLFLALHTVQLSPQSLHFNQSIPKHPPTHSYQNSRHARLNHSRILLFPPPPCQTLSFLMIFNIMNLPQKCLYTYTVCKPIHYRCVCVCIYRVTRKKVGKSKLL